jgi:hypothetical protein
MIGNILENSGFIDIIENPDGTYDATLENTRYKGLTIQDIKMPDGNITKEEELTVKFQRLENKI